MSISFTDRELDVMAVLWGRGSGSVAEVRGALVGDFAYTTVLTVLRTLERKGHVIHVAQGRTFRYLPAVTAIAAGRSALNRIRDTMFGGSRELMLAELVSERRLARRKRRRPGAIARGSLPGRAGVAR